MPSMPSPPLDVRLTPPTDSVAMNPHDATYSADALVPLTAAMGPMVVVFGFEPMTLPCCAPQSVRATAKIPPATPQTQQGI